MPELVAGAMALSVVGVWFWVLLAVVVLAAIISIEKERFLVTTPVVVIGGLLLVWVSHFPLLSFIRDNSRWIGFAIVGYLAIGVIYGSAKYMLWVSDIKESLTKFIAERHYNADALTKTQAREFAILNGLRNFPLRIADSKRHILLWMVYWPLSMPWTVLNEPVRRFFVFAYNRLSTLLQGWVDHLFSHVTVVDDPAPQPKEPKAERQILHG